MQSAMQHSAIFAANILLFCRNQQFFPQKNAKGDEITCNSCGCSVLEGGMQRAG